MVAFAGMLRKPITRLYVTHHPGHLLGAAALKAPICTLPDVTAKIQVIGDLIGREEHAKHNSVS